MNPQKLRTFRFPALVVASAATIALVTTWLMPAEWEASATILLSSNPVQDPVASLADRSTPLTVLHGLLTTPKTLNVVARELQVRPKEVQQAYDVEIAAPANQLRLRATGTNPKQLIAALHAAIAQLKHLTATTNAFPGIVKAEKLSKVTSDLLTKYLTALSQYTAHLNKLDNPSSSGLQSLAEPRRRLLELEKQLGATEMQLSILKKQGAESATGTLSDTILGSNSAISALRQEFVAAELKLATAEAQFGPQNPELRVRRTQYENAKHLLEEAIQEQLLALRAGLTPAAAKLHSDSIVLRTQIAEIRAVIEAEPASQAESQRLRKDVERLEGALSVAQAQLAAAQLEAEIDKVIYSVLEEPTLGEEPINKSYARNLLLAIALAGILLRVVNLITHRRQRAKV